MLLLSLWLCFVGVARAAAPAGIPSLAFERRVLPNGLTVLLREDHDMPPVVAVNLWYKVGSKNEEAGKTGFAHLFEHYMFEGSAHAPDGGYDKAIFACGGTDNATTNQDRTDYYAVVPTECLEEVLRVESDRMGFLSINQGALDKQRKIVKNEKRQRENAPYAQAAEEMGDLVFDRGHPYKWSVIGSMDDLDRASLADVKAFHDRHYWPNNAVLVVNGEHDAAKTLAMIEKWFGGLPAGPTPPALAVPPSGPTPGRRERTLVDDKAQLPMLMLVFRIPGRGKPGWQEAAVASSLLGEGRGSRLSRSLKDRQHLVLEIASETDNLHEDALFIIQAVPAPGVTLERVEAAIRKELDAFSKSGPTRGEMSRVKAGLRTTTLDALQDAADLAETMARGQAVSADPATFEAEMRRVAAMSRRAPQLAARKYLTPANTAAIKTVPREVKP